MTHQKILDTLDELMPRIASTRDPEGVMLKFAKENNLYPAQVEKLGHAFNQCKTLVGLQKQANRGDSFNILDVPTMVKKYATYTPADVLSKKEKAVHKKVDKITKQASAADLPFERVPLPDIMEQLRYKGAEIIESDVAEYDLSKSSGHFDITFNKSASEKELSLDDKINMLKEAHAAIKEAISNASTVIQGAREAVGIKCASIAKALRQKGPEAWSEMVEDVAYGFGVKSAAAIDAVENYLEVNRIPFTTVDLTKKSYHSTLATDRHGVYDTMSEVIQLVDMYKEASSTIEQLGKEKQTIVQSIDNLIKSAATPAPIGIASIPAPISRNPGSYDVSDEYKPIVQKLDNYNLGLDSIVEPPTKIINTATDIFVNNPAKAINQVESLGEHVKQYLPKDDSKERLEKTQDKLDRELALQQVMLQDPIIAEADPKEVQELYNTISGISPRFAKNPRMMTTALKEALQYGAVPISMLKDIAQFESHMATTESKRNSSTGK